MNIVVAGPTVEPLTLEEVRGFRRVLGTDEDALLSLQISAARQMCEQRTQRTMIETTRALILDGFPSTDSSKAIRLAFPPIQRVDSIHYVDPDGAEQLLDPALYVLDPDTVPGYIVPAFGESWPATRVGQIRSVRVQYVAGYRSGGTEVEMRAAVPEAFRMWMHLAIGEMYENREATITGTIASRLAFVDYLLETSTVRLFR
jgi:uncharacterized phiE125 gp8 family phage protein